MAGRRWASIVMAPRPSVSVRIDAASRRPQHVPHLNEERNFPRTRGPDPASRLRTPQHQPAACPVPPPHPSPPPDKERHTLSGHAHPAPYWRRHHGFPIFYLAWARCCIWILNRSKNTKTEKKKSRRKSQRWLPVNQRTGESHGRLQS